MKILIRIIFILAPFFAWGQATDLQNKALLAGQYLQDKQYDKAAELYEQLYTTTKSQGYLNMYLDCLFLIPDYEKAEKEIRKGLRGNSSDAYWYVQWGFLKKNLGQLDESRKLYEKAISSLNDNPAEYANLANQFIIKREYDLAEKIYLKAREKQDQRSYNYELARVYYYMRDYDRMMKEYLDWADQKETNLEIVKSNLLAILSQDTDQEISRQIKTYVLKRIQAEPNQTTYNRLLIWLFIQDKNFTAAIRQSIALDKRTGEEDANILNFGGVAASNGNYDEAGKAFDYLIGKGKKSEYYFLAGQERLQMQYDRFMESEVQQPADAQKLEAAFRQTFNDLGDYAESSGLVPEFAQLLAFYLNKPAEAIELLNKSLGRQGLNPQQAGVMKEELADVYVYSGDLWEAVLTYSQVIESNKASTVGDDVKFKKAQLGYFMGNFRWAKAQLDALRASTSKLIANDAMQLSLFISENMEDDSTAAPLRIFAHADLQLFRNDYNGALAALDSISQLYPYNSLSDDVDYRKAGIFQKQGKYPEAAALLESIVKNNSWDMLADDALFQLAQLYDVKLNQKEKAMELYRKMLTDYPASVFVVDSRAAYRKLQEETGLQNTPEPAKNKEDQPLNRETP